MPTVTSEFSSGQQLPVALERASLALLVLLPYIQDRLEAVVERWREDDEDGRLGKVSNGGPGYVFSTLNNLKYIYYYGIVLITILIMKKK